MPGQFVNEVTGAAETTGPGIDPSQPGLVPGQQGTAEVRGAAVDHHSDHLQVHAAVARSPATGITVAAVHVGLDAAAIAGGVSNAKKTGMHPDRIESKIDLRNL